MVIWAYRLLEPGHAELRKGGRGRDRVLDVVAAVSIAHERDVGSDRLSYGCDMGCVHRHATSDLDLQGAEPGLEQGASTAALSAVVAWNPTGLA